MHKICADARTKAQPSASGNTTPSQEKAPQQKRSCNASRNAGLLYMPSRPGGRRVIKTNIFFGTYQVIIADNGILRLLSKGEAEYTDFPDSRGTHPNNWHQLVTNTPMHSYDGCPYCYAHQHPEEIRQVALSLLKQKCLRCGYEFLPRTEKLPKTCPNKACKSPYWNTPYKQGSETPIVTK
ncbi:MAG: hypothetical protein PHP06_05945 [Clostridia bacterium]|nr:hypothetical protein [Clostridia bacterium]